MKNQTWQRKIFRNQLVDFKKEELDPMEKAMFIDHCKKELGMSFSDIARITNKPKSTLEDWYLPLKRLAEFKVLTTEQGLDKKQAANYLRRNRAGVTARVGGYVENDTAIERCISMIRAVMHDAVWTSKTDELLQTLNNEINRMRMYMDKNNGRLNK